ncbi:MbtH family protein [Micromonospora sp. CPCC 205546]|uniref:MbtH family protein n=1 Tax=Micromonospora sp. CPCC 205546 TaxID=3122397 RepID=UPI002FF0BA9B
MSQPQDEEQYLVVTNDEDQYSIWPAYRDLPAGWHARTPASDRQACLDYIGQHWVDMRPRSVRLATTSQGPDGNSP